MNRYLIATAFAALVVVTPRTAFAQAQAGKSAEPTLSAAEKAVFDNERAVMEVFKKQDWNAFAHWVDGSMYVDMNGVAATMQTSQMMDMLKTFVTNSYEFSDMHARTLTPDVIVVTYKLAFDQTVAGKHVPSPVYSMSVWQKKEGKWIVAAHSEATAADAK